MGRLVTESTVSGGTKSYEYNELNVRKKITNARGQIRQIFYDSMGRITGYNSPEGTVSYTYDTNGNVLTVTDSHGTITRTYDALNRVLSYTDTYGKVIRYEYDAVGNLSKIIYPDNTAVTYAYDANHNLIRVTDWANRVTSYAYDVNNRVVGVTKPDGSVTTTVYDNKQRVTSTVERTASGVVITGFEYIYDDLSRIIEEKHLDKNCKLCYTYDNLSRVTKRTTKNLNNIVLSEESFTYDAAGNITDAPGSCFAYDTNNRLVTFNGNAVSYDLDGNMLSNGSLTCMYDSSNKLITAGGHTYTYNAEDVRIRNLCNTEDTTYTYNTNAKLSMLLMKTTNGVVTKYVYGKGLIGEEVSGAFKTYHFDCRGSTIAITDICGNITDTFAYDTYGRCIAHTGNSFVIFGYNGRDGVVTDKNGLIYMRARYYSPDMKRFVNADIIAGEISNAVTLNRFAYANGNPVSFIDPFGLRAASVFTQVSLKDGGGGVSKTPDTKTDSSNSQDGDASSYGYSDDEYWDKLLGENDAIYVADYGLPGVAHAYVLLKNEDGSWIKTHFATSRDNLSKMKKNAKIYTTDIKPSEIIRQLSKEAEGFSCDVSIQMIYWQMGFIPIVVEHSQIVTVYTSGVQYIPLKGDFSESIVLANQYDDSKYNGYDLIFNNCAHYAQEILKAGTSNNSRIEEFLETSNTIIPKDLYDYLYMYSH